MDINKFNKKSQEYLSKHFFTSSFDQNDNQQFGVIKEPVKLSGIDFQPYFFKALTGYEPNKQSNTRVLYTFYLLIPPEDIKKKFLDELAKKNSEHEYDEKIIGEYYSPMHPEQSDFKELINDLTNLSEKSLFPGKDYHFAFHLVCPTADYNFALIFVETSSIAKLSEQYEDEVPFET
jgi:hypothetical protein